MDWIERLTGWAPDGGRGALEVAIACAPAVLALGLIWWAWLKTRPEGK